MMLLILQYIPDADDPHQIVSRLMDAVPPGSYLTVRHGRGHRHRAGRRWPARLNTRLGPRGSTPRTARAIAALFDGLDMIDPGLVSAAPMAGAGRPRPAYSRLRGMGRKP